MPIRQPSKAEVDALVSLTGEGRMHCNKELKVHFQREHVKAATTLDELKEVLLCLLSTTGSYVHNALELAEYSKKEDQ